MNSLFDQDDPEHGGLERVGALVAPVAANAGAVIDQPGMLDVARAFYEVFGELDATGGLTRAQLVHACGAVRSAFQRLRSAPVFPRRPVDVL